MGLGHESLTGQKSGTRIPDRMDPSMSSGRFSSRSWFFTLLFAAGCACVFWLPWFFPPQVPVKSESYAMGFNNQVAIRSLMALISLAALFLIASGRQWSSGSVLEWIDDTAPLFPAFRQSRSGYVILLAVSVAESWVILWWNGVLVSPYWSESGYFLSRIDLVALGFTPYVDFQHLYGPAMLYGPLWIDRLTLGHFGIEGAYALSIVFCYLAGNLCLFLFLRGLRLTETRRNVALLTGLLLFLPLTMGLNYAPLRFTLLPALLMVFHRVEISARESGPRPLFLVAVSFFTVLAGLLLSPEMGIALLLGLLVYAAVILRKRDVTGGIACVAGVAVAVAVIMIAFTPRYLGGIFSFSGGGNSFPIFPNLHNLAYLASLLAILPLLGAAACLRQGDARSPLALALCVGGGILIAAAFGRCDPGHVFINGVIPLMLMFAATSSFGEVSFRIWTGVYALCIGIGLVSYADHYAGLLSGGLRESEASALRPEVREYWEGWWRSQRESSPVGLRLNWRKVFPVSDGALQLRDSGDAILAGAFDPGLDRLSKLKPGYVASYHPMPTPELYSRRDVDRMVADNLGHDVIIVPSRALEGMNVPVDFDAYRQGVSSFLSGLMVYPVRATIKTPPYIPDVEVLRQLVARTDVVSTNDGIVVLKPKRNGTTR